MRGSDAQVEKRFLMFVLMMKNKKMMMMILRNKPELKYAHTHTMYIWREENWHFFV